MAASDARDISATEPPRVAFVIGNQAYDNLTVDSLKNPINDGKLIAQSLRRLNFDVVEGYDLTLAELTSLFAENRTRIDNAEAVVLYYAGHGFQLDGKNYVVPVDAKLTSIGAIPLQTVQLDALVAELENPDRPTLIFMDACRENPLPPSVDADTIDGLAQIEAGTNTFIAFSTELGKVSFGGNGNNSPFALAMVTHLETPGQSVSDLMIAVRNETQGLTLKRQTPWTQESLQAQFYFTDRQVLDPAALRLAAAQILNDPRQLEAFLKARDEENLSFLPAVFRARQRSVTVLGQPAPLQFEELYEAPADGRKDTAARPAAGADDDDPIENIAIASTAPANTDPNDDQRSNDLMEALMFARLDGDRPVTGAPGPQAVDQRELARQLQTELQRLGCYRMRIDGDWGRGSRGALQKYLKAKNLSADSLDPSMTMLNRASLDSGRICREPVIIKRKSVNVATRTPARETVRTKSTAKKSIPSFRRKAAKGQSRKAQVSRRAQRREALPPDLQMGVGIGF